MCVKQIPLLLFAKAPLAGNVKTRLTSHCSKQQAAKIAEILIDESLRVSTQQWPSKVLLSVWQQDEHHFIQEMLDKHEVELHKQVTGDLGKKMQVALDTLGFPAAILGCDAPVIDPGTLKTAYRLLSGGKSVIGPSEDGGYYFIGLNQSEPALFLDIDWGRSSVFFSTKTIADQSKIDLIELPQSYDIDRWDDVLRAAKTLPQLKQFLNDEGLFSA